jgi:hypothetical protein
MFSKVWALRDAATCKIQLMLTDEFEKQDVQSYLPALSGSDSPVPMITLICVRTLKYFHTHTHMFRYTH